MTFFLFSKVLASVVLGMLGIPLGILPSIFLFRDLANGTDASEQSKRAYAITLWVGIGLGWFVAATAAWWIIGFVFG